MKNVCRRVNRWSGGSSDMSCRMKARGVLWAPSLPRDAAGICLPWGLCSVLVASSMVFLWVDVECFSPASSAAQSSHPPARP
eukprot:2763945-Pyramimonas_sp.AAC.1